jgi:ribonuclease Z
LPGLLQTWDFNDREEPVAIHAPAGTRERIEGLVAANGERPSYPVRIHQVSPGEMALSREDYEIRAVGVVHRTNAVGYVLEEAERKGEFDREYAEEELGLPPGPEYSTLHDGQPVEHDGRTIQPEDVVGPPRPGRTVVYTGDTRPCDGVREAAAGADLLIHDSMFGDDRAERARETAHSTAREAAEVANEAGAMRLALTHISSRYAGGGWRDLEREAKDAFEGERVVMAEDGLATEIPYEDSEREFTVEQVG